MERDENGKIVADKARFPRGIKFLADYVSVDYLKLSITLIWFYFDELLRNLFIKSSLKIILQQIHSKGLKFGTYLDYGTKVWVVHKSLAL